MQPLSRAQLLPPLLPFQSLSRARLPFCVTRRVRRVWFDKDSERWSDASLVLLRSSRSRLHSYTTVSQRPLRVTDFGSHITLWQEYKSLRSFGVLPPTFSMSSVISSTIGLLGIYPYYKLAALFFSIILFRLLKKGRNGNPNGLPLPPGPKGYPLIGNLFDMPVHKPWVVYDEWRKTHGKAFMTNDLSPQITWTFQVI